MKHTDLLLLFVSSILLMNSFKYCSCKKFPLLPLSFYASDRISTTLLAQISKEFGAKMPLGDIVSTYERDCKDFDFYDSLRIGVEKYEKARKYFKKVEREEIKMKIEQHTGKIKTEKNKLNHTLIKQTFEKILYDLLQCRYISEKMEIAIKILLRRIQISKYSSLGKIVRILENISSALNDNKVGKVNKLELKLIEENQIDKLNMRMIDKISRYIGRFLRDEVDLIKKETENYLIRKDHKIE
jgi:hypothetical protein